MFLSLFYAHSVDMIYALQSKNSNFDFQNSQILFKIPVLLPDL